MEDNEGFTQVAIGTEGANRAFANVEQQKHGLFAQFYMHPKQNAVMTLEKGRPIYDETEYIRIIVPGDKASVVERPVRMGNHPNSDNVKFAQEYAAFKTNKEQHVTGTPLKQWPPISRSQALEMEYFNVRTVEQLAELSDVHTQKFAGLVSLRELARRFMQHANAMAPLSQMQAALDESTNAINTLNTQVQAQAAELALFRAGESRAPVATAAPAITVAPTPPPTAAVVEDTQDSDGLYTDDILPLQETEETEEAVIVDETKLAKPAKKRRQIAK
jgi:hypothetical protein|tara:strand:+ start:2749 stop:3573 length:825 start_codon:yes stop_codon:yes gene_type:complete